MRRIMCCLVALALVGAAYAELQNVEVGGDIRIRGRYWNEVLNTGGRQARLGGGIGTSRAIGDRGGAGVLTSLFDFDSNGGDLSFVEQRTAIHIKADFTDNVSAFIEFDSYDRWGEDFRSLGYVTGADARAISNNDVEVIQSYIDINDMYDTPVRLRIGRQEISLGKGWLVGNMISPTIHCAYDGIRATYDVDDFTIDAFWAKLAEMSPAEEDGDVDLYGVYGTYKALEAIDLSLYWVYVRDAVDRSATTGPVRDWVEGLFDLDDYDVTQMHTVGLRANGSSGAWDYDLELAYQFGEAGAVGATFPTWTLLGLYGDDDAEYDSFATDFEVGYTFDASCQPRVALGFAFFEGEDNRDVTLGEWINPFSRPSASVSFNRMFSSYWYTTIFDILGSAANMSNFWQVRLGVTAHPTESITTALSVQYFAADEAFDWPITLGGIAPLNFLPFLTNEADEELGVITHLWVKYNYSEDLFVKIGWEHLFAGDGLENGSFVKQNGLDLFSGTDDSDANYVYFDTGIKF